MRCGFLLAASRVAGLKPAATAALAISSGLSNTSTVICRILVSGIRFFLLFLFNIGGSRNNGNWRKVDKGPGQAPWLTPIKCHFHDVSMTVESATRAFPTLWGVPHFWN